MPPGAEQEHDGYDDGGDPFEGQALGSIDGDLMAGMPDDDRFKSGVPDGQRAGSLDFIQMTGLTRAPQRTQPDPVEPEVSEDDLDPDAPLSFYEKGVTDVDDGGEGATSGLSDAILDGNLVPDRGGETLHRTVASPSADAFKDIVASLVSGNPSAASSPSPGAEERSAPERSPSADLLALLNQVEALGGKTNPTHPSTDALESPSNISIGNWPSSRESLDADPAAEEATSASPADELTDDWDSLLDSVSGDGDSESPTKPLPTGSGSLAEAEQLMNVLGQKQAAKAPSEPTPSLLPTYSPATPPASGMDAELAYDYSATPTRRRSRRHTRGARRGKKYFTIFLILAILTGGAGALYFKVAVPMLEQDEDLQVAARQLESTGRFQEASQAYERLSRRLASDPAGQADALFRAAYVLTRGEPRTGDEKTRRYESAIALFSSFIKAYPNHQKRTRALTIMGRLYYELAKYDEAIAILRDEADPLRDPQAALTILRYIAQSYSQKGEYEAAESAYLQAATLPGNYSVDQDYFSLGEMFKFRAELPDTEENQERFAKTAADYWRRAIQVPGIEPSQKVALTERLEWLVYQEGADLMDTERIDEPVAEAPELSPTLETGVVESESEMPGTDGEFEVDAAAEFPDTPPPPEPETVEAVPLTAQAPAAE